ncbi:hypothetical protein [Alcanivorax sp.]|uniref:hypothetical protein n=1 Tax=Alcanivorax sp. TaxID=1872427 RepID=UPI002B269380|nr:hypothetical protein [Alcanivorax sp.]
MHPIEAKLIEIVKDGRDWQLEDLGGIEEIAPAARSLGTTPMMPELLSPLVLEWRHAKEGDREVYKGVLLNLLEVATTDFILLEAVDILENHWPLPDDGDENCFTLFLAKASTRNHSLSGFARAAVLDGAFRWASDNRRRQLRLLDFFLGLSPSDDIEFLRRAAKIVGVAYSHWRDKELVEVLHKLAQLEVVRTEASFELGMAALSEAMDRSDSNAAATAFREARDWFAESEGASERSPETNLYIDGLGLLLSFQSGAASPSFGAVSACVQQNAFELHAWSGYSGPSWLGARRTEAACWSALASNIAGLAVSLDEPSWWDPATVIEEGILSVYSAGRSILRRDQHGGVESLVRPRIRESVATQTGQAHQVRIWLQQNTNHEWAKQAQDLLAQVDAFIEQSGSPKNPPETAIERASLTAIIARSNIPEKNKITLSGVVENAMSLQLANLTGSEAAVIERCCQEARNYCDYSANANGARLFDTVLLWLVRFIFSRLELTKGNDPTGAYLFERDDGSLPREDELQNDFFRWVATSAAGSDIEPNNIASGRADIRLKSGPERIVVEVKREENDCSFDALLASYAAQTTDYQNVSIRLGVLLVLDLATPNREGTPHLTSLFEMREVQRCGESVPRLVLIVKVPGRRKRPSDLTRLAKSRKR